MKTIIFGTGQFAEIAHEYLKNVTAFTVNRNFIKEPTLRGLPVVAFEDIEKSYSPEEHKIFVAVVYGELNRIRERTVKTAKDKGYKLADYFDVFLRHSVKLGEHYFIFEDNTLQPFVQIGNNVVLWSGNHIGHHSIIEDNVFISSHVVISGNCTIGRNTFIGVNSTIGDGVKVGEFSWISPGAIITRDIPPHSLVKSIKSEIVPLNEEALFRRLKS